MILLECPQTGERCLVESADGYEGWTLVAENAPAPPSDHCDWCCDTAQWLHDEGAHDRAAKIAAMRDPEALLAIIEDLAAQIEALRAAAT